MTIGGSSTPSATLDRRTARSTRTLIGIILTALALTTSACSLVADSRQPTEASRTNDPLRVGDPPNFSVTALAELPPDPDSVIAAIDGVGLVNVGSGGFEGPGTITVRPFQAANPDSNPDTPGDSEPATPDDGEPGREPATPGDGEPGREPGTLGDGDIRAGKGLSIDVEGEFAGLLTLRLDATPRPNDDAVPAVLHLHDDGTTTILPAAVDPVSGQFIVQAGSFSDFIPSWLNPVNWIAGIIDGIADFLTGRTDPPACGRPAPVWASVDPPGNTVHTCFQTNTSDDGTDRAELYLKSNRHTSLIVTRPTGTAYRWVEGQPEWLQPIAANLTGVNRNDNILLPGGQALSFGFDQPEIAERDVFVEVYTSGATAVLDGILLLLGASGDTILAPVLAVNNCLLSVVGVDVIGGDTAIDFDWRAAFNGIATCAVDLLTSLTDPGKALGVVLDLESSGLIPSFPKDAVARGEAIDAAVASAKRVGTVAKAITSLGPALTTLYDRVADNLSTDTRAVIRLNSLAQLAPPTLQEIAVADPASGPVMIVVDTSGSMDEEVPGGVKIEVAKIALLNFIETIEPETPVGLWTYPGSGGNCDPGGTAFTVAARNPRDMAPVIRTLAPDGGTPTAEALLAAHQQMLAQGYEAGTIILVSDGESTCEPPCVAARTVADSGFGLQFIGVGFGDIGSAGLEELSCIADVTDGTAIPAVDEDELNRVIDDASRPSLQLGLDFPTSVVPEVGVNDDGNVEITATITNTSQTQADNVVTSLRFDSANPGVVAPTRAMGNLSASDSITTRWVFRPSLLLADQTVEFTVIASADNLDAPETATGTIAVTNPDDAADAGPLLDSAMVIMGDSFSAGEGADGYINGFDLDQNRCHRSRHTYLVAAFDLDDDQILACSGAVAVDLVMANNELDPNGNDVAAQLDQLAALSAKPAGPPSAVVMTMGGNDVGFGPVISYCLLITCSDVVGGKLSLTLDGVNTGDGYIVEQFELDSFEFLVDDEPDSPRLRSNFAGMMALRYAQIDAVLNSPAHALERGSIAPILIPAYPRPVPTVDASCPALTLFVNQAELDFVTNFITALNATTEAAVLAAHADGVPVYFIPNTEDAFLPNHTVCDDEPYARGIESFDGAGFDLGAFVRNRVFGPGDAKTAFDAFARGLQELFHPNADGYRAMSRAIIRWSLSDEARAAEAELAERSAAIERSIPLDDSEPETIATWDVATTDLGQLGNGSTLNPQTQYPLTTPGWAPGSPFEIEVRSEPVVVATGFADLDGTLTATVILPPGIPDGHHQLIVSGFDPNDSRREVLVEFRVGPPRWQDPQWLLIGLAVLASLIALIDRIRSSRPAGREHRTEPTP